MTKIAIIYDWMSTRFGGAEHVLTALHQLYPEATWFTSVYDPSAALWAKDFKVKTSWLQHIPGIAQSHRWSILALPLAFESFNLDEFEVVISVTSFAAKGVLTKPHQLHVCYLLTPPRYLYTQPETYVGKWQNIPIVGSLVDSCLKYLRWWDQAAASRPDVIVPISQTVSHRVEEYYHRQPSEVLYPPVPHLSPSATLTKSSQSKPYFLTVSRLVAYKRIDLAIAACRQLGTDLVIVGEGPAKKSLLSLADNDPHIQFVGAVTNERLAELYLNCRALLMPGEEDFGITGLESLSAGKPVIVHHKSGVAEIIQDRVHGIHMTKADVHDVIHSIKELQQLTFDPDKLKRVADQYTITHFQNQLKLLLSKLKQTV